MASETFGILGPLIHPEKYVHDERIAATKHDYIQYVCRLVKARPELIDRFFLDAERLTMH